MATLPCNNGKWSLGHYSRFAGEFTYTGSYNTAVEACAAAKMKAWVYDSAKKVYVPYNPGMKFDRVECAAENNSYLIENTYNVAFRHSPLKLTISSAGKQLTPPVKILAGEVVTILADQSVNWSVTGEGSLITNVQRSTTVLTFKAKAKGTVNITAQGKCETKRISLVIAEKAQKERFNCYGFHGFGAEVDSYISEASKRYGIDERVMRGLVKMENGWTGEMSPTAAIGVGQFTRDTWDYLAGRTEGKAIGMQKISNANFKTSNDPRYNKRINTLATGLYASINSSKLRENGLPVTSVNLYLMHNIGAGVIPALKGSNGVNSNTLISMNRNGRAKNETPVQFVQRQGAKFQQHYEIANHPQCK